MLPKTNRGSIRFFYPLLLLFISLMGILGMVYVGYSVHTANKLHMLDRASTFAQVITAEDIAALRGDESDLSNLTYIRLKNLMQSIRAVNHDIRFIYINGLRNGEIFFYGDSEDPDSEDYSPPGEPYPEATEMMRQIFTTNERGFEMDRDQWGYWASAYAPIVNATGEVVALVGVDVPAGQYILDVTTYSGVLLLFTLIALILIAGTRYYRKRERDELDQKAELLFVASHEIRMPLTGIRWASEKVLTDPLHSVENEAVRNMMTLIHDNSVHLINTVNNLLAVHAIEQRKKKELKFEKILIYPVIEQVVKSLKLTALERNVVLYVDESFPKDLIVECDIEQIRHVFVNLISNAIKYTNSGTDVVVKYEKIKDKHLFSIVDHGNGLSENEMKHIFDGYHRTDEARRSDQAGTGLGLYLSKKIAKMHGGDVKVTSKRGIGSVFMLELGE